jgi:integrase
MPRLTQSHPRYRLHKKSGQAIVTLSGKDHYLGPYGTQESRHQYDRVVSEWLANGRSLPGTSVVEAEEAISIIRLCARYLDFAETYYQKDGKPTSSMLRVKIALGLLSTRYGSEKAHNFGPLKLRAVMQSLIEAEKSRKYINYIAEQIKRIFKWGVSMELIPPSVFQALAAVPGLRKGRSGAAEPPPVTPVPEDTVQTTLPHLPQVVSDMLKFQRLTGCRPGEVCIVRPQDVNCEGAVWLFTPHSHKTEHHGKRRVIPIGPKAQDILRPYLLRSADSYCFSPYERVSVQLETRHARRKTPLSYGNRPGSNRKPKPNRKAGDRYTTKSYGQAIVRACEVAFGMPEDLRKITKKLDPVERRRRLALRSAWRAEYCWAPNRLRHSAGTEIRAKYGAEAAQVILGHSHLNVTEIYAERDLKRAAEIMFEVG